MSLTTNEQRAESDLDLFSGDAVADPYPALDALRDLSAAVYMTQQGFWLLSRYDDVRATAADWETFSSVDGVALTQRSNENLRGSVLASDPPEHDALRQVLSDKLAPRGLSRVRAKIRGDADALVEALVVRRSFDVVHDLSTVFPIHVVADLVGLPVEGREKLHPGADASFAAFGPVSPYLVERMDDLVDYQQWMGSMTDRSKLVPGGWGEVVMDAVDAGRLTQLGAVKALSAYMTAGMDTTVNAISALVRVFAEQPEVWTALQADPALVGPAFEEVLRLETPIQGLFRVTTEDTRLDGTKISAGDRVMLHWAGANRDPRHYPDPAVFDVRRNPLDHLAFGYGVHGCAGQGLARMEVVELLRSLLERVERFHLAGEVTRSGNPVVRSLASLPVTVDAKA